MGSLNPPSSGAVYFDTNVFIYSVEKVEPQSSALRPIWLAARAGAIEIVSSELVVLETLVKPFRDRDILLENVYRALLFDSRDVRLLPVSVAILERAARIRAETGLKTPDSIHAATALDVRAALFVTNDAQVRRVGGLSVAILTEV